MDSIDYLTDVENVHLCILLPLSRHILADFPEYCVRALIFVFYYLASLRILDFNVNIDGYIF